MNRIRRNSAVKIVNSGGKRDWDSSFARVESAEDVRHFPSNTHYLNMARRRLNPEVLLDIAPLEKLLEGSYGMGQGWVASSQLQEEIRGEYQNILSGAFRVFCELRGEDLELVCGRIPTNYLLRISVPGTDRVVRLSNSTFGNMVLDMQRQGKLTSTVMLFDVNHTSKLIPVSVQNGQFAKIDLRSKNMDRKCERWEKRYMIMLMALIIRQHWGELKEMLSGE